MAVFERKVLCVGGDSRRKSKAQDEDPKLQRKKNGVAGGHLCDLRSAPRTSCFMLSGVHLTGPSPGRSDGTLSLLRPDELFTLYFFAAKNISINISQRKRGDIK